MGSLHAASEYGSNHLKHDSMDIPSMKIDGKRFRSFKIHSIISDQITTPTGLREDLLLSAWLIVLLRTRESDQLCYGWGYKSQSEAFNKDLVNYELAADEVVTGLQDSVGQVAVAISRHITTIAPARHGDFSSPVSLLLRTDALSKCADEAQAKGVIQLEVCLSNGELQIYPLSNSEDVLENTIIQHMEILVEIITWCILDPNSTIEDCVQPTTRDLDEIWGWNHLLPSSYNFCMHDMVSEQTQRYPDKVAISSWDGSLTYAQIEQYSTLAACALKDLGVKLHDVVPVCFEKSKWTIVAVLAAMKAGSTFVLMDPTLPLARLQNMAEQVGAKSMLSSRMQHDLSKSILPSGVFLVVEAATFAHISDFEVIPDLPTVPPSVLMYIIFTSGSTGTPKGVKISHKTYTSSAVPRARAVGYMENWRVLDFASYAFDVSIDSMFLTLANGGCLCIPSDEDRLNDINAAIRDMQINYAGLTPSLARILDADVISSLSALGLGGEAVSARDVTIWGRETRIVIGYGPCECTIGCTINSSAATGRDYLSIGNGNGAAIWVANPDNHDLLVPVGAVGELLVEGPIVGQGYLNDPEKTAAAFVEDPKWLTLGHRGYAGRRGRLYKTGDLGKYDPDGSGGIVFVGRKDSQVKLRGQRVELGEIESQLKAMLPSDVNAIAEVITPLESGGQPTLVAFIATHSIKGHAQIDIEPVELQDELQKLLSKADTDLAKILPRYMVPTAYLPINHIPVLVSSKTDRKRLKQYGATVNLRELVRSSASTTTGQLTDVERRLRHAWSQVLKLDADAIRTEDNFFALGGDSLAAMRLVSTCRTQGLDLTVANAFRYPTLSSMASTAHVASSNERMEVLSFSMISRPAENACLEAAQACNVDTSIIEDIYPCTPTQESLFTFSLKSVEIYVAQRVACIPSHIDVDAWKHAWEEVVDASPILRTRLAQLQEPGLQQVVVKENISWRHSTDLTLYLEDDRHERMELGENLARYAIVEDVGNYKRYMVWTVHHVLYDGWSEPLVLQQVSNALHGRTRQQVQSVADMKHFVKWVCDTDRAATQEFWRTELRGAVGPQFPHLPSRDYLPTPDITLEQQIPLRISVGFPFTTATLIRGAWALVASQYTGVDDVVFGETLTGRDISLVGVESIVGPLVATIPIRTKIDRASSIEHYLSTIQQAMAKRAPYQHMGWQYIRRVSEDAQHACEATTGLVIQPESEHIGNELGYPQGDAVREALHFNPYPLMLSCGIHKGGVRVCANFDSKLIEAPRMERILAQLDMACFQLTTGLSRKLNEISCLPEAELNQIWRWNQNPPLSWDESTKVLRADTNIKEGCTYPRAVVPWVCDPRNPTLLSPIGCVGELWLEGNFLSHDKNESPVWLVAGSSACAGRRGRLQTTGDLVQMQEDGSLKFMRRKENTLAVQGHAVDTAELRVHLTNYLPLNDTALAAQGQELIVFVEQSSSFDGDIVQLMQAEHELAYENSDNQTFNTNICSTIPISLAGALKKLDKFTRDSLPPYLVPSAYVVVDKIPDEAKQDKNISLTKLALTIPSDILCQVRKGLKEAWTKSMSGTKSTTKEDILRSSWANILKISPDQIELDDNFFRLGGDSVLAMKLVSNLRRQGHVLTVANIFQNMRLGDAAKVLKVSQMPEKAQAYKPFSMLGQIDIQSFLSENVQPKLANPLWLVRDVLPVTDSQALDVRATIQTPRTSIQYTMIYLDKSIDREKLFRACNDLVKEHEILRTVFVQHNSEFLQVVLDKFETPVTAHQADKDLEQSVTDLCTAEVQSNFQVGSSFLRLLHVEGSDGQGCLVIGLSHAQYDGVSLPRLLQDLTTLYAGGTLADFDPFSTYIARIHDRELQKNASDYWRELLRESKLSILPGPSSQPGEKSIFQQRTVNISSLPKHFTTATLLTAAWALVLSHRLQTPDITFGNITSGRNIGATYLENIIGPCYQFTPVRVPFQQDWTAVHLLQHIQTQLAHSSTHDFLGFEKIAKECTNWPAERGFFNSIVHHQDVIEEEHAISFGQTKCRIQILNPHGEAPEPLKVVSFVMAGQTHVGLLGREQDGEFLEEVLGELGKAVEELAGCGDGALLK